VRLIRLIAAREWQQFKLCCMVRGESGTVNMVHGAACAGYGSSACRGSRRQKTARLPQIAAPISSAAHRVTVSVNGTMAYR